VHRISQNNLKTSNSPKKAKKNQISVGLSSKIKKAKGLEKSQKITNLASKKPKWQP